MLACSSERSLASVRGASQHPIREATVIVPGEEKLHWRFMGITIKVPRDRLDAGILNRALDFQENGALLESSDVLASQSHAFFHPAAPAEASQGPAEHVIYIESYRFENEESEAQFRRISDSGFFDALRTSIHGLDPLSIVAVADLYYPASRVSWRMKMLASPPRMDEIESEIGAISLSGVSLRFSDSPHGLLGSLLETSPGEDEYRCELTFANDLGLDQLESLHRTVARRAEAFAQLFVDWKVDR